MKKSANTAPNPDALKPVLEDLLALAKKHGADGGDAIAAHGRSLSIGVREGGLEDIDNSEGKDIGLRVFVGKRQACVSSSDLSKGSLSKLAERAVAMAKLAPEDPYCGLAPQNKLAQTTPDLDVFDPATLTADDLFERARETEAAALSVKGVRQAEGANAYTQSSALHFMTSDGFSKGWHSTSHGLSVSAIAVDGDKMERDYDYDGARWLEDLKSPDTIGLKAGTRAIARLGAKQIPSGALPVMFERRVSGQILSAFISAICGPAITRGVSYLKDDMDKQIFDSAINITDDPLRKRGSGSHPWDGEGVTATPLNLIEDGVLKSWLLHSASARQLGHETTGHASRGMSSPPGVSNSNTHIHAGEISPGTMMKDMGKGLLISEMFGPSINANTGDFSVGIAGFAIEGGARTYPVSEVTIAGNLKDMFMAMSAADDLVFDQPVTAPSLLISSMVIAGE